MLQQILWHNKDQSFLKSGALPAITDNQLLVEARYSLISTGTERLVISENIAPATAANMRVPYMQGEFTDNFTYGYSLTGTVVGGPQSWLNKRVHLLHPHQRYAVVDVCDACELPDSLDLQKATLISNMETAINAVWDARIGIGDSIAVLGYGIIGTLLSSLLNAIPGTDLWVVEPNEQRAADAQAAGLIVVNNIDSIPSPVDIAFNTAGNSASLQSAIECTGYEGLVIELSWYGDRASEVKLGGSFHYQRKKIVASQVSSIPGHKRERWNYTTRKALVLRLLQAIDTNNIISKKVPFSEAASFFNTLRQQPPPERGIILDYQEQ